MADDQPNEKHQTNIENEDTLTNQQGHPVTDNQDIRTVGNRGPATLENYDFIEKSATLTAKKYPNVLFMPVVQVPMAILSHTALQEMSRFPNIRERKFPGKRETDASICPLLNRYPWHAFSGNIA